MKARLKLKPGQKGTKALHAKYGDSLVCVRYRYDEARGKRFKTVELIVDEKDWTPPPVRFAETDLVPVLITYAEQALQEKARAAGGTWNPKKKVWFIRYGKIKGTVLEKHILLDAKQVGAAE